MHRAKNLNLAHRLKVTVKIVKGLQNAIQAIREGQRLRRVVKRKNIVCNTARTTWAAAIARLR